MWAQWAPNHRERCPELPLGRTCQMFFRSTTSLSRIFPKHTQQLFDFASFEKHDGRSLSDLASTLPGYLNCTIPSNGWYPTKNKISSVLLTRSIPCLILFLSTQQCYLYVQGWVLCIFGGGIWMLQYSHLGRRCNNSSRITTRDF